MLHDGSCGLRSSYCFQGPGLPFSDIADALLSSTTNQLLLAPPPPPRPEQEEEEETSKMEQQPQPQTPLASPSAPLSPVSPSSPTHPGSLRRSRSTRKVSMVGQGSFNCDNGVDAMAYAALMDANATSPKARGDEGRDTDVEAGTAPTSPVILGSRDLRRLSPMNRSQSASRIVVSSPVNINMSQARQSLITQQAQQQLQQDGHDGSPSARYLKRRPQKALVARVQGRCDTFTGPFSLVYSLIVL